MQWIQLKYVELFFSCICFRDLVTSWKTNPVLKVSDPTLPVSLEKLLKASTECFLGNKILEAKTFCGKHILEGSLHLLLKADI